MKNGIIRTELKVKDNLVGIMKVGNVDYISLTDLARYKNPNNPSDVIKYWMSNKNSFDFYNLWEILNNVNFNSVESHRIKINARKSWISSRQYFSHKEICSKLTIIILHRFWIFHTKSFHCYALHNLIFQWSVRVICYCFSDSIYHFHTFDYFSECSVGAVKVRRIVVHDKELGTCGVWHHASCHGKNTFCML